MRNSCREGNLFEKRRGRFLGRTGISCRVESREWRQSHNWRITILTNSWFGGRAIRERDCEVIEPTVPVKGLTGGVA